MRKFAVWALPMQAERADIAVRRPFRQHKKLLKSFMEGGIPTMNTLYQGGFAWMWAKGCWFLRGGPRGDKFDDAFKEELS